MESQPRATKQGRAAWIETSGEISGDSAAWERRGSHRTEHSYCCNTSLWSALPGPLTTGNTIPPCSGPAKMPVGCTKQRHLGPFFWRSSWQRLRQWLNPVALEIGPFFPTSRTQPAPPPTCWNTCPVLPLCGPALCVNSCQEIRVLHRAGTLPEHHPERLLSGNHGCMATLWDVQPLLPLWAQPWLSREGEEVPAVLPQACQH